MQKKVITVLFVFLILTLSLTLVSANPFTDFIKKFFNPPQLSPDDGMVAYFKFDGNTNDVFGNNPITAGNPTYVEGVVGQAISFDGSSYLERNTQLVSSYPFSISLWVKSSGIQIFTMTDKDSSNKVYGLRVAGGEAQIQARNTEYFPEGAPINTAEWNHLVGVYNSNTDKKLYINGNHEATLTNFVSYSSAIDRFSIGRAGDSTPGGYLTGEVDELRVYNRALSESEITELSLEGQEPPPEPEPSCSIDADCNDQNTCTTDTCSPTNECQNNPVADNTQCNLDGATVLGICLSSVCTGPSTCVDDGLTITQTFPGGFTRIQSDSCTSDTTKWNYFCDTNNQIKVASFTCGPPDWNGCNQATGACIPTGTCTSDCEGKVCGDDGCGGTCGTCSGGETCNAQGQCDQISCTPQFTCTIEPTECPPDGIQTETCVDNACDSPNTERILFCNPGTCSGCISGGACLPIGYRIGSGPITSEYCEADGNFYFQKEVDDSCQNNFECLSNQCSDSLCVGLVEEIREQANLLQQIWCRILHPFSVENYEQCLLDLIT